MARRDKQTRDDFPTELRYTQKRIWFRSEGADTGRLGYAMPALGENPPTVYFVDLQLKGYLIEGRVFGALDFDTTRIELVAPFSGRILEVNWEVLDDPLHLMSSPFQDGWFYRMGRLKQEAIGRMLDRDAFWSFLEFERTARMLGLAPVLGAQYRTNRLSPWMDDLRVSFGGQTILTGRMLQFGRNKTFTPQWRDGERWHVELKLAQPSIAMVHADFTSPREVTVIWAYEVLDTNAVVAGDTCYRVKVIEVRGTPPQTYYVLTIGKDDFSLRLVEEVSTFDEARRTRLPNDWGRETYMELRRPREILLDLPLFPAENRDEDRVVLVKGEPIVHQSARFPDAERMVIACEAEVRGTAIRSEQTWRRGQVWWSEARRSCAGIELMRARLLPEEPMSVAAIDAEAASEADSEAENE